jgi:hypothetical protein
MQFEITKHWNAILTSFPDAKRDIYFTEEYVKLYENGAEQAECVVCREGEKLMLFPFIAREFAFEGKNYKDFETAYGYGGPVCNCDDKAFVKQALVSMRECCTENGFVAGFVRFHPLLQNQEGFEAVGHVIADRKTVAIDLDQPMDEVWRKEIHSKNRNMIRKAEKACCRFVVDDGYTKLNEFVRLYDSTMDKLSADGFYYFSDAYYENLVKGIPNSFLGYVENIEGTIISAAIFMYSGPYGHYHLSGSDKTQLTLSPNNFMLWNAAVELQKRGVRRFHLGGGTNGDEDNPLFMFKHRFSKDTCQFCIGKMVFNEEVHEALCRDWEVKNPEKIEQYKHHLLKYKY